MSRQKPVGVVYSTDPDYHYQYDEEPAQDTLPPDRQRLRVSLDRHHRGGKTVTLVSGFVGTDSDLQQLAKLLKSHCGVGGSAKEGQIIIQGDHREKILQLLAAHGYKQSK